jgi:hypothetical protein
MLLGTFFIEQNGKFLLQKKFTEDSPLNIPFWLKFIPRTYECGSFKSNDWLCDPIHG